jgi:alpha-tubulin suppressor-like RCC1 family protein
VSISTQGARCLALDSRGTVWFWGLLNNDYDKNIHEYLSIPTIIEDFYDVKMIKAGGGTTSILIRENGSCWEFDFSTGECTEIFK